MRMLKLTLVALAAVIAFSGSAWALKVKKKIEIPGEPAEVWVVAGETFCTIKDWHPAVAECKEVTEGEDTFRVLTLGDGGKIKEKLTGKDDMSYSYEIVEGPLPVKNYSSKIWVEQDDDDPGETMLYWQSKFEADGANDEEAEKIITGILRDGVKGIKKNAKATSDDNADDNDDDDNDDNDEDDEDDDS